MPNAPLRRPRQSTGNGCALIVCDSRFEEYFQLHETVFSALGHFGIPYRIHDLAVAGLDEATLSGCAVVVLGQDNLGLGLTRKSQTALYRAVSGGLGLVNFDYNLTHYDSSLVEAFGLSGVRTGRFVNVDSANSIAVPGADHWLTWTQEQGAEHRFNMPLPAAQASTGAFVLAA